MKFQLFWPAWKRFKPALDTVAIKEFGLQSNYFCWSIFQFHWYSKL